MAKRGRPPNKKKYEGDMSEKEEIGQVLDEKEEPESKPMIQTFATDQDAAVAGMIQDAGEIDEAEFEKVWLDVKSRGNYYDLVANMWPYKLPDICEKMQDRHERKYAWWSKESMQQKCDPSQLLHWTPVNLVNHPMLPASRFDRQGGVCSEGQYLCYMPWRMYEAREEINRERNRIKYEEEPEDIYHKEDEYAAHYKPEKNGPSGTVMGEGDFSHRAEKAKRTNPITGTKREIL